MAEYIARCFAAAERMRTTGGSAADDRAVIIGIGHMLDCGSIRIGEIRTAAVIANNPAVGYSVESVAIFCIGGSRKGGRIGIYPAGHVARSAIGERQTNCAQPEQSRDAAKSAVTPESAHADKPPG